MSDEDAAREAARSNASGLAVASLLERIAHLSRSEEQGGDLNPAQWTALRFLGQANRFSRTPMGLSRYLGTTRGTVSQTMNALEKKGYVIRAPNEFDKRSVVVNLTEAGARKLDADPIIRVAAAAATELGDDIEQARSLLTKLLGRLIADNEGRAFGVCRTCRHFREGGGVTNERPHVCGLIRVGLAEADAERICVEHEPTSGAARVAPR